MKVIGCWIAFSLLISSAGWAQSPRSLSLDEASRWALQNSPRLAEARARLAEADHKIEEAAAASRPKLSLNADYRNLSPQVFLSQPMGVLTLVPSNNYNVSLSLTQNLYSFGRTAWSSGAARYAQEAQRMQLLATQYEVVEEARLAYLDGLTASDLVGVAEAQLESRRRALQDAQALEKRGVVAHFDVLRSSAELARAQQDLLVSNNRRLLALTRLRSLLGLPPDEQLDLQAVELPGPPPSEVGPGLRRALQERPEIAALGGELGAARARVGVADSQDAPSLDFYTDYQIRSITAFNSPNQFGAGIRFSLPLFDGGLTASRTAQAEEVVNQVAARLRERQRLVELEVESAFLDLQTIWNSIEAARLRQEQSLEARRLAGLRYTNGLSNNLELLDAQAALSAASTDLVQARRGYVGAWTRWNRATANISVGSW